LSITKQLNPLKKRKQNQTSNIPHYQTCLSTAVQVTIVSITAFFTRDDVCRGKWRLALNYALMDTSLINKSKKKDKCSHVFKGFGVNRVLVLY